MRIIKITVTVVALAFLLANQPVNAEVNFSIINGEYTEQAGAMTISMSNDVPVAGIQFDVTDEGDLFAVDSVYLSDRAENWKAHYIELPNGDLRVLAYVDLDFSTTPTEIDSGGGALFEVDFTKTEETSLDSVPVSLSEIILSDVNGNGIDAAGSDGFLIDQTVGVSDQVTDIPAEFALNQNYPNPFNATTNIPFALPKSAQVKLTIYNLLGQEVKSFRLGETQAGVHSVRWDGANAAGVQVESGIYFYQIVAGNFTQTKKMVLLK